MCDVQVDAKETFMFYVLFMPLCELLQLNKNYKLLTGFL